jgi:acyl carrier protein
MLPATESEVISGISESGVKSRVREFVQENFLYAMPNFVFADDDRLLERGVVDSMGIAEMIAFVETEFGVMTSDEEVSEANFGSLSAIAGFVCGKHRCAVS